MHSITKEVAVTLDKFSVIYRNSNYTFSKEGNNRYWTIYNKQGSRSGMYYKDDILNSNSFEFFLPKRTNTINY